MPDHLIAGEVVPRRSQRLVVEDEPGTGTPTTRRFSACFHILRRLEAIPFTIIMVYMVSPTTLTPAL